MSYIRGCQMAVGVAIVSTLGVLLPAAAHASVEVVSVESGSEIVWTSAEGPYVITAPIKIDAESSLHIEPGTAIRFANGGSLTVFGTLTAHGTEAMPVCISSIDDDSCGGVLGIEDEIVDRQWGIVAQTDSTISLKHTNVLNTQSGITAFTSNLEFDHVLFNESDYAVHLFGGSGVIANSTFSNMHNTAILAFDDAQLTIQNSIFFETIQETSTLIQLYGSMAIISGTQFLGNKTEGRRGAIQAYERDGFGMSNTTITHSQIRGFNEGIVLYGSTLTGMNLSVTANAYGIVNYTDAAEQNIQVYESDIFNNSEAAVLNYGSSTLMLERNWWGSEFGPRGEGFNGDGDMLVSYDGAFLIEPWLHEQLFSAEEWVIPPAELEQVEECCSNVLFIPGIKGSNLYSQGLLFENKLWIPNRDADVQKLMLDADGKSIENVYVRDVVNSVLSTDLYNKFGIFMDGLVADGTITEWDVLPYDWRLRVVDSVAYGIKFEDEIKSVFEKLEQLAASSETEKVTLIGHSNGGVFIKALMNYLEEEEKDDLIDDIVLVGSPQLGTPRTVLSILHGDGEQLLGGILLSKKTARAFAGSISGGYTLLPSDTYFSVVPEDRQSLVVFDASVAQTQFSNLLHYFGDTIDSWVDLRRFLQGDDNRAVPQELDTLSPAIAKQQLLDSSEADHEVIDDWRPSGTVEAFQIVGIGLPTVSAIRYSAHDTCLPLIICATTQLLDHEPIYDAVGDASVITESADAIDTAHTAYIDIHSINKNKGENYSHATMMAMDEVQEYVASIIKDEDGEWVNSRSQETHRRLLRISVHSPVLLDVYDSNDNHTGLVSGAFDDENEIQYIEQHIPNSVYDEIGEGKYVVVDAEDTYSIALQAIGSGSFTLKLSEYVNGTEMHVRTYADVPVVVGDEYVVKVDGQLLNDETYLPELEKIESLDTEDVTSVEDNRGTEDVSYDSRSRKSGMRDSDYMNGLGIVAGTSIEIDSINQLISEVKFERNLYIGSTGADVTQLQMILIALKSGPAAETLGMIGSTGYFGSYTQNAVAEFQIYNLIEPTAGYFGPLTRAVMLQQS